MKRTKLAALAGALALVVGPALVAQAKPGHPVVSASAGLFSVAFPSGTATRISAGALNGIESRFANLGVVGIEGDHVFEIDTRGARRTLATMPAGAFARAIARDQQGGTYVVATAHGVLRVSSTAVRTLSPVRPNAICRDRDTGDFVAATVSGTVYRIDRSTGASVTIARGLGQVTGIDYLPATGQFAVARNEAPAGLLILNRNGTIARSISIANINCVAVDEGNNAIFAARAGTVYRYQQGAFITSASVTIPGALSGIALWRDNPVSVDAQGLPGERAVVHLRFARTKSAPYCIALSLAAHPGIPLGSGQRINLAPDGLFLATACGRLAGVTAGFSGSLDNIGSAFGRFLLLNGLPSGLVVHVSAVAVNPALPDGLDVGNGDCVKID